MASLRKAKKQAQKQGITLTQEQLGKRRRLYEETRKQVEIVNRRLKRLDKSGNYGSWASNKLFNALDGETLKVLDRTRKGKKVRSVKLKRGLNITQLKAIQKASNRFLKAQTSTVKGVEKAIQSNIKGIQQRLSDPKQKKKVTKEDAQLYYEMFKDKDYNVVNEKIKYDVIWDLIDEANSKNTSQEDWIKMLGRYIDEKSMKKDLDLYDAIVRLYKKYVEE